MQGRLIIGSAFFTFAALVVACSSNDGGSAPVPGVASEGLSTDSFSCVRSEPVKRSDLSKALHRECCCAPRPHHLHGYP
jgi:hypothetical protein